MPVPPNLVTLFQTARDAYLTRDVGMDAYLRSIDFHLRSLCLLAAGHLAARGQPLLLEPSPGLSSHISYLKSVVNRGSPVRQGGRLFDSIHAAVQSATNSLPGQTSPNIEHLRNHLFHGGTIPPGKLGDRMLADVCQMECAIFEAVRTLLTTSPLSLMSGGGDDLAITIDGVVSPLPPLILVSSDNVQVLGRLTSRGAQYLCPGSPTPRRIETDERALGKIRPLVRFSERDRAIADLVEWVREDLSGFANPDHGLHFTDDDGIVTFFWVRQMPVTDEQRSDAFRLGQDDQRQWRREDGEWVPYSELLKALSIWPRLAERLRQQFQQHTCLRDISARVSPKVTMRNLDFSIAAPDLDDEGAGHSAQEFLKAGDEALTRNRGQTLIIFLSGEAGIGKTSCLVKAAFDRARQVEQEPDLELPLYLYVSSTGNVLAQLENVIQAAVAPTKNLTKESVLALCRNSLMIILVDGFDELVGGLTYSDAVGSLRPWMEALGGRGVMIVSARSSYYLQQYQRSVAENTSRGVAANHLVAELQRWDSNEVETYLIERNVPRSAWSTLPREQQSLLCIPFYATELAKWWHDTGKHVEKAPGDLRELMINRFLEREADKLRLPGSDERLLSIKELQAACVNLAELMAQSHECEVGLAELEYAVDMATGGGLSTRRGLRERLTVLCGLGVRGESDPRFAFDHELYFDCFLGEALLQYLIGSMNLPLKKLLEGTLLKKATVDIVTSRTTQLLAALRSSNPPTSDVGRHNFGQLWGALLERGFVPSGSLVSLRFGDLDLSGTKASSPIHLEDCEIQRLAVDVPGSVAHVVRNCRVEQLEVRHLGGNPRSGLTLTESIIRAVRTPTVYEDTPGNVQRVLADLKLVAPQRTGPGNIEAYEFFLDRISSRAEISIIIRAADNLADDPRLHWTEAYGVRVWHSFVRDLVNSDLAQLVAFPGSGESKRRLRLLVGARTVLDRAQGVGGVSEFWARAAG